MNEVETGTNHQTPLATLPDDRTENENEMASNTTPSATLEHISPSVSAPCPDEGLCDTATDLAFDRHMTSAKNHLNADCLGAQQTILDFPCASSSPCTPSHSKKQRLSLDEPYSVVPEPIMTPANSSIQDAASIEQHMSLEEVLTCIEPAPNHSNMDEGLRSNSLHDSIAVTPQDIKGNASIEHMEYPGSIMATDFSIQCPTSSFMVDYGRPESSYTNPSTSSIGMSPQLCSPSLRNASKPLSQESCSLSSCTLGDEEVLPPKPMSLQHSQLAKFTSDNVYSETENLTPRLLPSAYTSSMSRMEWRPTVPVNNNQVAMMSVQANERKDTYSYGMLSNKTSLQGSISAIHSHKHACSQCDKVFDTKAQLKAHELLHDPCHKFPCCYPNCDRSFKSESYLQNHIRRLHKNSKNIVCCHCDFATAQKKTFDHHMLRFHKDCSIPCCVTGCPFRFRNQMQLMDHIDQNHTALEGSLQCPHCSQAFSNEATLALHRDQCYKTSVSKAQTVMNKGPAMSQVKGNKPSRPAATSSHPDPYDFSKDNSCGFMDSFPATGRSPQQMMQHTVANAAMRRTQVDGREVANSNVSCGQSQVSTLECILDDVVQGNIELTFPLGSLNSSEQCIAEQVLTDVKHPPSKDNPYMFSQSQATISSSKDNSTHTNHLTTPGSMQVSGARAESDGLVPTATNANDFFPVLNHSEDGATPARDSGPTPSDAGASSQHHQRFLPTKVSAPNETGLDSDDLFSLMSEEELIALELQKGNTNPLESAPSEKSLSSGEVASSCSTGSVPTSFSVHSTSLSPQMGVNDHLRSLSHLGDKFLGGNGAAANYAPPKTMAANSTMAPPNANMNPMHPHSYHPFHKQQIPGATVPSPHPFDSSTPGLSGQMNFTGASDPRSWPNPNMRNRFSNLNGMDATGMTALPQTSLRHPAPTYMDMKMHQAPFSRSISYHYPGSSVSLPQEMHNSALLMRQQSAMNPYVIGNAELNPSMGMAYPHNYVSQQEYLYQRNLHAAMTMQKQRAFMSASTVPNPYSHSHVSVNPNCGVETQIPPPNWGQSVMSQQQHQSAMMVQQQRIAMGMQLQQQQQQQKQQLGTVSSSQYIPSSANGGGGLGFSCVENGMAASNSGHYYNHDNSTQFNAEYYNVSSGGSSGYCVTPHSAKYSSSLSATGADSSGLSINQSSQPTLTEQ